MSKEEATPILKNWLDKCNEEKRLDFDTNQKIRSDLKYDKGYFPPSKEKLKKQEVFLYKLLLSKDVVSE